ncbi:hypothetical protein UFOVP957_28 [uncultured Caudovirales phage]|uniref:Uncharacterized protein n=1 Tax=uncultured Caudovirales phage TaxID=2100421 RepID=A0A6J5LJN7_9CAUD|nr:hypothetical protein UFOVP283_20 [uncultured Caudovirales phage]CAB4174207.1 hypothetical protein UFOVP957_28 [uncultured Caudovirales phage]CAB4192198.1 hypothetical protein UFOVP1231_11 [uncultured Caudovirales phage]
MLDTPASVSGVCQGVSGRKIKGLGVSACVSRKSPLVIVRLTHSTHTPVGCGVCQTCQPCQRVKE